MVVVFGDVSTAFLHAALPEPAWMIPPPNMQKPGMVWRLSKAFCGLRRSPQLWQEHVADCMQQLGFVRLRADPQIFIHSKNCWMLSVHVDDLLVVVPRGEIENMKGEIKKKFKVKWIGVINSKEWSKYLGRKWRRTDL
eukprot:4131817-Heterocapsa_arctica.AAC.1